MYRNRDEVPGGLRIGDLILVAELRKVDRSHTNSKMDIYSGHWLRVTGFDGILCHADWEYQSNPGKHKPETPGWQCEEWYWYPEHIAAYRKGIKHMEQFRPTRSSLPDI